MVITVVSSVVGLIAKSNTVDQFSNTRTISAMSTQQFMQTRRRFLHRFELRRNGFKDINDVLGRGCNCLQVREFGFLVHGEEK